MSHLDSTQNDIIILPRQSMSPKSQHYLCNFFSPTQSKVPKKDNAAAFAAFCTKVVGSEPAMASFWADCGKLRRDRLGEVDADMPCALQLRPLLFFSSRPPAYD